MFFIMHNQRFLKYQPGFHFQHLCTGAYIFPDTVYMQYVQVGFLGVVEHQQMQGVAVFEGLDLHP